MSFPTTYCITCKESGRTDAARANFAAAGVPARFVQGYYGKAWGLDTRLYANRNPVGALQAAVEGCKEVINLADAGEDPQRILDGAPGRIFPACREGVGYKIDTGHVGLCLSHWLVWQLALDRGCEEVLVCEDDCDFVPGFLAKFMEYRRELPADWDIFYAGCLNMDDAVKTMRTKHLCSLPSGYPFGTHCMLIRGKALPVLLERCTEAKTHVDSLIAEKALPHLRWFCSYPSLAGQHSAQGTWPHAVGGYDGSESLELSPSRPVPVTPAPAGGYAAKASRDDAVRLTQRLDGWCPAEKAYELYDAVFELSARFGCPLNCVELGVFGGKSLLPIAMALRDSQHGGYVTGIDPYTTAANVEGFDMRGDGHEAQHARWWARVDFRAIETKCRQAILAHRLQEWCTLRVAMPDGLASEYDDLHLLHLDDSHAESVALRNAQAWVEKVLPGGLIFLDDCTWPSVAAARAYIQSICGQPVSWDPSEGRRWEVYRHP